ncbi:MAG: hypothetical protein FWC85_02600 [Elusimicrobia bacterium]|nr:hypothetical protein [Elusimicrobiota bacterium]
MYKIKNFKINLRNRDILRVLKRLSGVSEMPAEVEENVQRACFRYGKFITPATLYQTFTRDFSGLDFDLSAAPAKWVAQSYYIVTIGTALDSEFKKNETAFGAQTAQIVSAIAVDALEQSKNFVGRLLTKEAANEKCEVSRPQEFPPEVFVKAATLLESTKIGVEISENIIKPQYSSCGVFYWVPLKKRR